MPDSLSEKLEAAVWAAHSLYDRGKTSGSSANLSFLHSGEAYITASGSCFGTLRPADFARLSLDGESLDGKQGSKEFALHKALYDRGGVEAVLHTHSTYAAAWSCLTHPDPDSVIPPYTPYLEMKLGRVKLVPYGAPGSPDLFAKFRNAVCDANGYLLQNHGPLVCAKSIMDAYYAMEELEESARLAWMLEPVKERMGARYITEWE